MNTSQEFIGKIGSYDAKLIYDDAILLVELEDILKMSKFSRKITKSDDIRKMSLNICDDRLQLFELLKVAAEGSFSEISLEFNFERSSLIYQLNQRIPFPKKIQFEINLEKQVIETDVKIQYLLEKYIEKEGLIWSPNFVPGLPSISVSDDKKVIKKVLNENTWQGILAEPKLPCKGKNKFSVKILNTTANSYIMIGVALSTTNLSSGAYSQGTSWMFYCSNNYIYVIGSSKQFSMQSFKPSNNDIITVVIDMDCLTMGIEVNGFSLGPACKLNLTEAQKMCLCPAVDLYNLNDSVKIL